VIALPPIQFDRTTGVLEGANAWERLAALALSSGSKVASSFSLRGYNSCANLLRKTLPERDIAIRLNPDAMFEFPYGDVDRIKVSTHVGYNVFGTASAFWQNRINALNANAARRMQ